MPSAFCITNSRDVQIDDNLRARIGRDGESMVLVNAGGAIRLSAREVVRLTMFFVELNDAAEALANDGDDDSEGIIDYKTIGDPTPWPTDGDDDDDYTMTLSS